MPWQQLFILSHQTWVAVSGDFGLLTTHANGLRDYVEISIRDHWRGASDDESLIGITGMTHEELIQKAVAEAKRAGITEELLRPRLRETALIYFDTRGPDGAYKVLVDLQTGDFISAELSHTGLA